MTNSIGPHFYALDAREQAHRIEAFAQAILQANPAISLYSLGLAVREALRALGKRGATPKVTATNDGTLEIRSPLFHLTITPTTITHVYL